ncbi:hypothetical protein FG167_13885 [Lacinutrix sp. WUR7]|uniref:hypothetical protein n=1 Tax=Lacinutrix sp. WUR7 TaxID=2653681 RepID=UPI00193E8042|nr:hypothetical protein [Lacinutrix sp. WUR7]QRM90281.1 hypothetical protein FG167_13885 [Lacinutrix sp. WUR7]
MSKKKSITRSFFKKITVYDVLFSLSFLASLVVSIAMDKKDLVYVIPVVIFTIILKYISVAKKETKPLFIFALLAILVSNVLSLYNFEDYFMWITIATSLFLFCTTLVLRGYLSKTKLKSLLTFPFLTGFILVSYLIFAVLELIIDFIPGNMFFFTFLCIFFLLIYALTFAMIYVNNMYNNVVVLLASGIFYIFQICLSPINEFFIYNKTFTVLIIVCNILSIYLLMKFVSETNVLDVKDVKEKYI